jgi:hypothetical protein
MYFKALLITRLFPTIRKLATMEMGGKKVQSLCPELDDAIARCRH